MEDGQAGQGGRERERTGGSRWASGAGRNENQLGRPARRGRRHGTDKISMSIYVGRVCVGVQDFLQGEVGTKDRSRHGWIVRSVSERTTSGTVGTGDLNMPYVECTRPI